MRHSTHLTVLTGAGVSAESGVPTFRDAQTGLWADFKPEDLATPEAFSRNPRMVWEWYAWRRERVHLVEPNPGHHALVALQARYTDFTLVTQNVDGLHTRAGSRDVIALHGDITRTKCFHCERPATHWEDTEVPPRCAHCRGPLRPDVVWFGENLPQAALSRAMRAARTCEVFLSIGTSSLVYPAAELPLEALRSGAVVVEINPEPTPLTPHAHYALQGRSGEVLPELISLL